MCLRQIDALQKNVFLILENICLSRHSQLVQHARENAGQTVRTAQNAKENAGQIARTAQNAKENAGQIARTAQNVLIHFSNHAFICEMLLIFLSFTRSSQYGPCASKLPRMHEVTVWLHSGLRVPWSLRSCEEVGC